MKTFKLIRDIKMEEAYDLAIAGGGPAGTAAAVCAARLGARVLLLEATGCLGGMGTSGLVTAFDPMADGERMLVGGIMKEIVEILFERGFLKPGIDPNTWRKDYHKWTPFHPEGLKLILDELVKDAGVAVRFFTRVVDADVDADKKCVKGLILQNIEGYSYIRAKTFIDATGDAVFADLCGVPCWEAGRDTPRIMPATLTSLFANIDWENMRQGTENDRAKWIEQAFQEGVLSQLDRLLPGMSRISKTLGYLNGGHMFNLDALRCSDLTAGMMLGRKIAQEYAAFYRKYIPGCENLELAVTASLVGVRESRRIKGEYVLDFDDYISRRQFPDQIAVFNKYVDIHPYDCSEEEFLRFLEDKHKSATLNHGECQGIPYGSLVPVGWSNLWVAGRCVSCDVKVQGSIRVMPAAAMMGEAAGTAAVQSIRTGRPGCDLDTELLVTTLRARGAYLPQPGLSQKMTKSAM